MHPLSMTSPRERQLLWWISCFFSRHYAYKMLSKENTIKVLTVSIIQKKLDTRKNLFVTLSCTKPRRLTKGPAGLKAFAAFFYCRGKGNQMKLSISGSGCKGLFFVVFVFCFCVFALAETHMRHIRLISDDTGTTGTGKFNLDDEKCRICKWHGDSEYTACLQRSSAGIKGEISISYPTVPYLFYKNRWGWLKL